MTILEESECPIVFEVDGQTAASWQDVICHFDDASIYQSFAYGAVRWGAKNLSHLVMKRGDNLLAAVQLRIVRTPFLPLGIAYVRWGPLCRKRGQPLDASVLNRMLNQMRSEYCETRGLVLRIIPNTYADGTSGDVLANVLIEQACQLDSKTPPYQTIHLDLLQTAETIRKHLNQKWRNQLNKSEKNGLLMQVASDAQAYAEFLRLYREMRTRKGFDSAVDVHEFGRIQEELSKENRMTIFLAKKDEQTVGAIICSLMGGTAIYLLGATSPIGRDLKASYFLHWQAILWLKSRNASCYDLGGIDAVSNPGGYHFKSGFGGREVSQHLPLTITTGCLGQLFWGGISWLQRLRAKN